MKYDREFFDNKSVKDLERILLVEKRLTDDERTQIKAEIYSQKSANIRDAEKLIESPMFNLAYIRLKKITNAPEETDPHDFGASMITEEVLKIVSVADKQGQGDLIVNFCKNGQFPVNEEVLKANMESELRARKERDE